MNSSNVSRFSAADTGTARCVSEVTPGLAAGKWVVLEIDVQGAMAVVERYPRRDYDLPPAQFARGTGAPAPRPRHRNRRGHPAAAGSGPPRIGLADRYRYQVINDDMDQAVQEICDIIRSQEGENRMIEELREEAIVNKVGGRFKLSTLIQKRLVALNAGSRPLVDIKTDNKMQIVIQEIMQDKIYLDSPRN